VRVSGGLTVADSGGEWGADSGVGLTVAGCAWGHGLSQGGGVQVRCAIFGGRRGYGNASGCPGRMGAVRYVHGATGLQLWPQVAPFFTYVEGVLLLLQNFLFFLQERCARLHAHAHRRNEMTRQRMHSHSFRSPAHPFAGL